MPKKVIEIVEQYTGPFARRPETVAGDGRHTRLIVLELGEDGKVTAKELFRGKDFSFDEFSRRMKAQGLESALKRCGLEGMLLERPVCPGCGGLLGEVVQPSDSPLNEDQWAAERAGDWVCKNCSGTRGVSGHRYFWDFELGLPSRP